ncbi:MarR family transcriptional regulator [Streptomyces rubrogriseus]|uniref:MarR family transcriptional regulator n=1 Tax=Streptomyces rubrogriseus TaxID=194673 RepID=UPI00380D3B6C
MPTAIADNPNIRIRNIAAHCRLTDRAVQRITSDLKRDGYLSHTRDGRTNTYRIQPDRVLRHPAEAGLTAASIAGNAATASITRSRPSPACTTSPSPHDHTRPDATPTCLITAFCSTL